MVAGALLPALSRGQAGETLIVASMKYIKNPNPLREETWYDWWLNLVTYDRIFREGRTWSRTRGYARTTSAQLTVWSGPSGSSPNIESEDVVAYVREVIERLGLEGLVEVGIHDSYTWSKTDPRHPAVRLAVETYSEMGMRPYLIPMMPGSAPSYLFTRTLGLPMVSTGPGHGGRAHAPNEYVTVDTVPSLTAYTALLLYKAALAGIPRS